MGGLSGRFLLKMDVSCIIEFSKTVSEANPPAFPSRVARQVLVSVFPLNQKKRHHHFNSVVVLI